MYIWNILQLFCMSHDLPVHLHYSLLVEGLFRYNAHFIVALFSLCSHHERYNEVAVYSKTRWNLTGSHQRLCLCLMWPWPFDLMSMSQAQVRMWPCLGDISSNIFEDIVFTSLCRSLPADGQPQCWSRITVKICIQQLGRVEDIIWLPCI